MTGTRLRRAAWMAALVMSATGYVAPSASARSEPGPEPRIIGGEPAEPGEYPFMAAILNEDISGDDYQKQFCGGSLIDDSWVLTAAHCVEGRAAASLAVAVGRTLLNSTEGRRVDVAAVFVHPDFGSPTSLAHDAALLHLASPVTGIAPIQLAGATDDGLEAAGTPLTVIGWGNTNAKGRPSYPDELREVQVPVVGDSRCDDVYGASFHAPTMVCAGTGGTDSCQGDSGGPLFSEGSTRIQVGIVSWGNGCAKKRFPGVYGEVNNAEIRSWVVTTSGV